jgi:regulator of ribonuclease activity A
MKFLTTDLCDKHPELVRVVEPVFTNYGGKVAFGGQIVTVKCHEDNSLVRETAGTPGQGKVLVVDGELPLPNAPSRESLPNAAGGDRAHRKKG